MKPIRTIKTFKDIKVGDQILGSDGTPTTVTAVYDEHMPESMYEVTTESGEIIEASGNHLWYSETNEDRINRENYFKLAQRFLRKHELKKSDVEVAYPLEIMVTKFGENKKTREFIKLACESLGHVVETPEVFFDNYMDIVDEVIIKRYSYNDLIDFLLKTKDYIETGKGYLYFGKVRTTDELSLLIDQDINIPTIDEINQGN